MTPRPSHPLLLALDARAGRGNAEEVPEGWRDFAARLAEARRPAITLPPCPVPLLRRVQGLFAEHAPARGAALLRLVFDSWRARAPAVRGAGRPRDLRYEGKAGALDLRLVRRPDGGWHLQIAVEPPVAGLSARVETPGSARPRTVALDDAGVGEAGIPAGAAGARVTILEGTRALLRTARVPLE